MQHLCKVSLCSTGREEETKYSNANKGAMASLVVQMLSSLQNGSGVSAHAGKKHTGV